MKRCAILLTFVCLAGSSGVEASISDLLHLRPSARDEVNAALKSTLHSLLYHHGYSLAAVHHKHFTPIAKLHLNHVQHQQLDFIKYKVERHVLTALSGKELDPDTFPHEALGFYRKTCQHAWPHNYILRNFSFDTQTYYRLFGEDPKLAGEGDDSRISREEQTRLDDMFYDYVDQAIKSLDAKHDLSKLAGEWAQQMSKASATVCPEDDDD